MKKFKLCLIPAILIFLTGVGMSGCVSADNLEQIEQLAEMDSGEEMPNEEMSDKEMPDEENTDENDAKNNETDENAEVIDQNLVILYTNDVHCSIDKELGYAQLAGCKEKFEQEGNAVLTVDAGDYVQGGPIGTVSKGAYTIDIMNKVPYDVATLGNHEFDYGMSQLKRNLDKAEFPIVCCNLIDEATKEPMLPAYQIFDKSGKKIAFVGVTTPATLSSSNPAEFKDSTGKLIYSFCQDNTGTALYEQVQKSVDEAREKGADYVILLSHLGVGDVTAPWMSTDVIINTTGIDAVIDGHSHTVLESETVKNKAGRNVVLTQTGAQFENIGVMTITPQGTIKTELKNTSEELDTQVQAYIDEILSGFQADMARKIGTSDVTLVVNDPETGERIVRNAETNAGDFCADACRFVTGAEIAICNGGGVRSEVNKGDLTYGDIINLHPFANTVSVMEVTGQMILDALEMGARKLPEENGGFLQVSGMKYKIDMNIPSSVSVDDTGAFISVDGTYRVKEVTIGGKSLDTEKTYILAGIDYILRDGGDGMTMFQNAEYINESFVLDSDVVIEYVTNGLNGHIGKDYADPYGEGRIIELD